MLVWLAKQTAIDLLMQPFSKVDAWYIRQSLPPPMHKGKHSYSGLSPSIETSHGLPLQQEPVPAIIGPSGDPTEAGSTGSTGMPHTTWGAAECNAWTLPPGEQCAEH